MHAHMTDPESKMDSRQLQSVRAGFGVPARIRQPMPIADIEIWTPFSVLKAYLGLLAVPARRMSANDV